MNAARLKRQRTRGNEHKELGSDHPDTLQIVQKLGLVRYRRGQFEEAEKMWRQVLAALV
jgi:hypothetical protein